MKDENARTPLFGVRLEPELKAKFKEVCDELGMPMGTMLNVFVRRVVRDRGVPFAINAEESAKADGFATGDVLRWVGERGGAPAERISLSREQLAELLVAPKAAVA